MGQTASIAGQKSSGHRGHLRRSYGCASPYLLTPILSRLARKLAVLRDRVTTIRANPLHNAHSRAKKKRNSTKGPAMSQPTIESLIRAIPDFPKPGIMFRDVTTLFADTQGFRMAVDQLLVPYAGQPIDKIVALEARGFILGGAMAHQLGCGFVPIRKAGKLPGKVLSQAYTLEYGEAVMEIHDDALQPGETVLVVDDLLATGGTAEAGIKLIERLGAEVIGCAFVVDLPDLGGNAKLRAMGLPLHCLVSYEGD